MIFNTICAFSATAVDRWYELLHRGGIHNLPCCLCYEDIKAGKCLLPPHQREKYHHASTKLHVMSDRQFRVHGEEASNPHPDLCHHIKPVLFAPPHFDVIPTTVKAFPVIMAGLHHPCHFEVVDITTAVEAEQQSSWQLVYNELSMPRCGMR